MPRINASSQGVKVEGLNELNRALRALGGKELQTELKGAGLEVAKTVAHDAAGKARALGGVAAKAAPSLTAAARYTGAGVSLGGSAYPFAGGAEFGGGRTATTRQFKPWRGNGASAGYFIYPSIRDNAEEIGDTYLEAVTDLARKYGLL